MKPIKFYSENDMTVNLNLGSIIEEIESNRDYNELDISSVLILQNIKKFLSVKSIFDTLNFQVCNNLNDYLKTINSSIGKFIHSKNKSFLDLRTHVDYIYADDFYEIFESYKIYNSVEKKDFILFMTSNEDDIYIILKHKKTVTHFKEIIKEILLKNSKYIEIILESFLNEATYFVPEISNKEFEVLLKRYIESDEANLNILKKIIMLPPNIKINVSDKTKLMAKRTLALRELQLHEGNNSFFTEVTVSFPRHQTEEIIFDYNDFKTDIKVSWDWIESNNDYPTLWNNFIFLFGFFDYNLRLNLVSNKKESGVLEALMIPDSPYLYHESGSFLYKEMTYDALFYSYIKVLEVLGIHFEDMVNWFFTDYLLNEYGVEDFIVTVPNAHLSFFEKCRTIIPEIDRILKQYALLIDENKIDHDLIQISSSSVKISEVPSFNSNKYYYPAKNNDWYNIATHLLFSNQSGIYYRGERDKKYRNFFHLITSEVVKIKDFSPYQKDRIDWLIEQELISISSEGTLSLTKTEIILVLRDLYSHEVLNIFNKPENINTIIQELFEKGAVYEQTTLFTIPEQHYLDYYLNKSKFTNGYDIRNKYVHGTNTNDSKDHEKDYYMILKIIMIIIVKINDDLDINSRNRIHQT
ncbi:hypothetical protein IR194_06875 [Exiguobacterium sp. PBE]|uniref:hypothetical protein n=1 Tax=Exiguobacterium profundum TaxID=307643 RepID=UPI0018DAE6CE|nr:hypothetical protein [Exiguobacterium profundum]QPI68998.1 hypothetical protein IR194_06875 [Exiguobacterium sp. PBE]